jgi:hypothetical protein
LIPNQDTTGRDNKTQLANIHDANLNTRMSLRVVVGHMPSIAMAKKKSSSESASRLLTTRKAFAVRMPQTLEILLP